MALELTHVQRCIISGVVYVVCFILEIVSCLLLYKTFESECVGGAEISTLIWWCFHLVFVPAIPDIMYAVMGVLISDPFYASMGGCYNIVMGVVCISAAICGFVSLTGCGNPAQSLVLISAILELIAGIIHLVFIWFVKENLDDGESLFG
uniref:MARVEL domain-containing protein n=2 Tax=Ceratitis capitata TaxID=7213 RepID=W8CDK1_CERCA